MAYFQRRRGRQVTVYYHDRRDGKIARLSRAETKHMDDWSDAEVRAWLVAWEKDHGREVRRALLSTLRPDDDLSKWRDAALLEWRGLRPFRDATGDDYERNFRYIEEYFVGRHGLQDVRRWVSVLDDFPKFLKHEKRQGIDGVKKICQTLMRFGTYLVTKRIMLQPWWVATEKRGKAKATPLQHYLTTEEVISVSRRLPAPWGLVPLLGYFCPLRPQELFALSREDFLTGQEIALSSLTHKRLKEKHQLGTKLSVNIYKTLMGAEPRSETKTDQSVGITNIWHPDGALEIAAVLKQLPPEGRLFPGSRSQVNDGYASHAHLLVDSSGNRLKMSPKDWSRLCGVEMRLRDIQIELVKDQFRHTSITTTQRYMRIPAELLAVIQSKRVGKQDLDDVV